jgi:hypothetical protein
MYATLKEAFENNSPLEEENTLTFDIVNTNDNLFGLVTINSNSPSKKLTKFTWEAFPSSSAKKQFKKLKGTVSDTNVNSFIFPVSKGEITDYFIQVIPYFSDTLANDQFPERKHHPYHPEIPTESEVIERTETKGEMIYSIFYTLKLQEEKGKPHSETPKTNEIRPKYSKNNNWQLRNEPQNPTTMVSPWLQTSFGPDLSMTGQWKNETKGVFQQEKIDAYCPEGLSSPSPWIRENAPQAPTRKLINIQPAIDIQPVESPQAYDPYCNTPFNVPYSFISDENNKEKSLGMNLMNTTGPFEIININDDINMAPLSTTSTTTPSNPLTLEGNGPFEPINMEPHTINMEESTTNMETPTTSFAQQYRQYANERMKPLGTPFMGTEPTNSIIYKEVEDICDIELGIPDGVFMGNCAYQIPLENKPTSIPQPPSTIETTSPDTSLVNLVKDVFSNLKETKEGDFALINDIVQHIIDNKVFKDICDKVNNRIWMSEQEQETDAHSIDVNLDSESHSSVSAENSDSDTF